MSTLIKTATAILFALLMLPALPAAAQSCYGTSYSIPMGTVSRGSNTDSIVQLPYTCQSNANAVYYTLCLFIGEAAPPATGIAPRRLTNYRGEFVNYNIYSNPTRTNIVGADPNGSGYPIYTWQSLVPGGWVAPTRTMPLYVRVPPVPGATPSGSYQANGLNTRLRYAFSSTGYPATCTSGPNTGVVNLGFSGATATVPSGCSIGISNAQDMDFGTVENLASPRQSVSSITLDCPLNTQWQIGLSNGLNAVSNQRRMRKGTDYVAYELYRNSGRTSRWGNTPNVDTLSGTGGGATTSVNVYGTVPTQVAPAGSYLDTITITLTY